MFTVFVIKMWITCSCSDDLDSLNFELEIRLKAFKSRIPEFGTLEAVENLSIFTAKA